MRKEALRKIKRQCNKLSHAISGWHERHRRRRLLKQMVVPKFAWGCQWMRFNKTDTNLIKSSIEQAVYGRNVLIGRSRLLAWAVRGETRHWELLDG